MIFKAKLKKYAAMTWAVVRSWRKRTADALNKIARTAVRWISRLGAAIVVHKEAMGYYAVLTLVLVALGAAANDYRSRRSLQGLLETLPEKDPGISVQSKPDPTLSPKQLPEYILPVHGTLVNGFSDNELNWSTTLQMWQTHPASDIAAAVGEAVVAAADGTVVEVYSDALYGNCIVIDHGEEKIIRYASLNTLNLVQPGQTVRQGDIISSVGNCDAEVEFGAHVHLEYFVNEQPEDFMLLIEAEN